MRKYSPIISVMSGPGSSVTTESPDKQRIPCKYKRKKTSKFFIKGKEIIQEPNNPSKREKENSITDEEKHNTRNTYTI